MDKSPLEIVGLRIQELKDTILLEAERDLIKFICLIKKVINVLT
jgi:hypothetical protein